MNSVIERILLNKQTKELMGEKTSGHEKSRLSLVKIGNYSASKVLLPSSKLSTVEQPNFTP